MALIRETGQVQGDRVPPQSVELEMCVLGAIMLEPKDALPIACEHLDRDSFYLDGNGIVFALMCELLAAGTPPDSVAVLDALRSRQLLDKVGGSGVIMAMLNSVPTAANVEYHSRKVAEKAYLRAMIRGCTEIIEEAYKQERPADEMQDLAEQMVQRLAQRSARDDATPIGAAVSAVMQSLQHRMEQHGAADGTREANVFNGLRTGLVDIDNKLCGLAQGDLCIVAGRPGEGKSSIAMNWTYDMAVYQRAPVGWISMEMSAYTLAERLIAFASYQNDGNALRVVSIPKLRKLDLSASEFQWAMETAEGLVPMPVYIRDRRRPTIQQIKSSARAMHSRYGIQALFVDYLTLIQGRGGTERYDLEVTQWTEDLRSLAGDLRIPVVLLAQLKRDAANRRPRMSDLSESGGIERTADAILMIWNEGKGIDVKTGLERRTIIIEKSRNGPTGDVPVLWFPEATRFLSYSDFGGTPDVY